jgi:hypothetical protein
MAFIIYCLPRSRSAWIAHYLNYPLARPPQPVGHSIAPMCESVENIVKAYKEEGMFGTVELEGMIGWQIIRKELPHLRIVTVRRPLQEVYLSIAEMKMQPHLTNLAEMNELLNAISSQPGVYTINSADLDSPTVCKWLFEYCLELEFDFDWWSHMTMINIQVSQDDAIKLKPELDKGFETYKGDVLERMKGIQNCLH